MKIEPYKELKQHFDALKKENEFLKKKHAECVKQFATEETNLRQNNIRLQLAVEAANLAWWEMNVLTGTIKFDKRKAEMIGYEPEEFSHYSHFMKLVHPDDYDQVMDAMRQHFTGAKERYQTTYRIKAKNGEYKWFTDNGVIVEKSKEGKPLTTRGYVIDSTEQKIAEERIKTRDQLIRGITEISQILLSESDIDLAINISLELIGKISNQDRTYIFEYHKNEQTGENLMSQRYEWTKAGIKSEINNQDLQNLSFDALFPRWFKELKQNNFIEGEIAHFPESERSVLEPQDIVSILIVPVTVKNKFWGFFGFDNCQGISIWDSSQLEILKTMASLIGMAIMRYRYAQDLILAKEKAQATQKQFKAIASQIPGVVYQFKIDKKGSYSMPYLSASAEAMFERPYNEMLDSMVMFEGTHPDDMEQFWVSIEESRVKMSNWFYEYRVIVNNKIKWIRGNSTPIKQPDGSILWNGVLLDITEQKNAEAALINAKQEAEKNEEKFKAYTQHVPIAIYTTDEHGDCIYANSKWLNIAGLTLKESLGKGWEKAIHPDDREFVAENWYKSVQSEGKWLFEYRFLTPKGKVTYVEGSAKALYNNEKKRIGYLGANIDITERKQAEKEKAFLAAFVENSNDIIVVKDLNRKVMATNMAFAKAAGHKSVSTMIGKTDAEIYEVSENTEPFYSYAQNDFDTMKLKKGELQIIEEPVIQQNHIKRIHLTRKFPIFDSNDKIFAIGIISQDITQQKEAAEKLKQIRENYETFFNTIDEFLFVLDEQGNIMHCNQTVIHRLGYTIDELLGNSVLMVHPAERRVEAGRIVGEMLAGTADYCHVPLLTKKAIQIAVETRVTKGIWNGMPAIFGVSKDISKIQESEEKFSKVFYLNPSACSLSDIENGDYIELNDAFTLILGFTKQEALGKSASQLGIMNQATREYLVSKFDSNGKCSNVEVQLKAKNGEQKYINISAENINVQNKTYRFTVATDITQHKLDEQKLKESVQRNIAIIRALPDMLFRINNKMCYVDCETPDESFLLVPRDQLIGKSIYELLSPELASLTETKIKATLAENKIQIYEYSLLLNYELNWFEARMVPSGKNEVLAIIRNITQHKLAEQKLKESLQRNTAIVSALPDILMRMNSKLKIIDCETSNESLLLMPSKDFLGKTIYEVMPIELAELTENKIGLTLSTNEIQIYEYQAQISKDVQYFESRMVPCVADEVLVIIRDITERKLDEQLIKAQNIELIKAKEKAEQSELKVRSMFQNSLTGFLYFTPKGKVLEANPSLLKMMGSPSFEASSQQVNMLNFKPLVEIGFDKSVKKCLKSKKVVTDKTIYHTNWGKTVYLQYFLIPVIVNNKVEGVWANLNDLTDLWQTQQDLILAKKQIEASEEKYRLIAENTSDGILVLNADNSVAYESPSYQKMTGRAKKLEGDASIIYDNIHPDDRDTLFKKIFSAIAAKQSNLIYTYRAKHREGYYFWREDYARFNYDNEGTHLNTYIICRDITQQKVAQIELEASEKKYRELANSLPIGVFETDTKGTVTFVNKFVFDNLGYTIDDIDKGLNILAFVAECDRERAEKRSLLIITENMPLSNDYAILKKNGETIPCIVSSIPIVKNEKVVGIRGTILDINERIKNEALIQEQLKKYNALLSTTSDGFFMIDNKGRILDVNANFCSMLGFSRAELLNLKLKAVEAIESSEDILLHIKKIKKQGFDIFESRLKSKKGKVFDVEVSASYWADKDQVFSFIRDISAKKIAAQKLLESEKSLQEAQNMAHMGNWEVIIKNNLIWASDEAKNIYGLPTKKEYFTQKEIEKIQLPEFRSELKASLNNIIKKGLNSNVEFQIRRANDGEIRFIHSRGKLVNDEKGNPQKVVGVVQDITKQKMFEIELRKLTNAIEQNPASIVITNANGDIEYVNPTFTKVTGYTKEEALGKNPRILKANVNPQELYVDLWQTISAGNIWRGEFCNAKKSGELFWELATISPVRDTFNSISHYVAIKEDITEKKELDRRILRATLQGEEKERNRFSRELHDGLGPLLSTIKLYFQWVSETNDDNKKQVLLQKGDNNIKEAIASLREISNNLSPITLSKFGVFVALKNFIANLNETEIVQIIFNSNIIERLNTELEINLYRIVLELINNSIKHANAKTIEIDLFFMKKNNSIKLNYSDNGKGFDYKQFKLKDKGRGLTSISNRVESFNGILNIKSEPGKGFLVIIEIPNV